MNWPLVFSSLSYFCYRRDPVSTTWNLNFLSSSTDFKSPINFYISIHWAIPSLVPQYIFFFSLPVQTMPLSMGLKLAVGHWFSASICSCSAMQGSIACLLLLCWPQIIGWKIVFKSGSLHVRGNDGLEVNLVIYRFPIPNLLRFYFFKRR